jgi:hypothetical protein
MPSVIRVYSKLKHDETLILKGWKLSDAPLAHARRLVLKDWLFRTTVAGLIAALALWVAFPNEDTAQIQHQTRATLLAQIRYENKNGVQVRYVKPELLQSIEFETTNEP